MMFDKIKTFIIHVIRDNGQYSHLINTFVFLVAIIAIIWYGCDVAIGDEEALTTLALPLLMKAASCKLFSLVPRHSHTIINKKSRNKISSRWETVKASPIYRFLRSIYDVICRILSNDNHNKFIILSTLSPKNMVLSMRLQTTLVIWRVPPFPSYYYRCPDSQYSFEN